MSGFIFIIGIGPGSRGWLAPAAEDALHNVDIILGYQTYLRQIRDISPGTPREGSGMRHEIERARRAIELAKKGKRVALVSGGDAGIYGMAGLVLELLENHPDEAITVEVLPGITALTAAAALLGAPLMTDFAAISLSDYLIPLETIMTRLQAAIQGDFVICLYNPQSHQRVEPFNRAITLLSTSLGPDRPIGIVRGAYRVGQEVILTTLKSVRDYPVNMDCILIIGNRSTRIINGKLVTPRGYSINHGGKRA